MRPYSGLIAILLLFLSQIARTRQTPLRCSDEIRASSIGIDSSGAGLRRHLPDSTGKSKTGTEDRSLFALGKTRCLIIGFRGRGIFH